MDISGQNLRTACADLNGQMRGKRLAGSQAEKLEFTGHRMPLSALSLDLWGQHVVNSPLVFLSGDADGQLRVTDRGPVPMPWLEDGAELVPMWMFNEDGRPFDADPRHALNRVLKRFAKRGWAIQAGAEVEFTLVDDSAKTLRPARSPINGRELIAGEANSPTAMDHFAAFFDDLYAGAEAMGIALQSSNSEAGVGQFEVTLRHGPALRIADDIWLFKSLVHGMARKHAMAATFLAKPFAEDAGNALHLHFSVTDGRGTNLFDNAVMTGSPLMKQAVAGCVAGMAGASLIFAPHAASYDRMVPESHAPTGASWGYENRTTAIRIPAGDPAQRRIEHRAPGADTNPYLVMAAVLGAAMMGIEDQLTPPDPILGNAYGQRVLMVPTDWDEAITRFEASPKMARIFPGLLIDMLTRVKRQEQLKCDAIAPETWLLQCFETV